MKVNAVSIGHWMRMNARERASWFRAVNRRHWRELRKLSTTKAVRMIIALSEMAPPGFEPSKRPMPRRLGRYSTAEK